MKYIDPVRDLGKALLEVEKPNRYVGGEYGRLANPQKPLQTLIAFPDLYEIGMSNQALRILYNGLNRLDAVSCDRAFAPAPDFEALLKGAGLPLYGLDTGIALHALDILLITLGYELGITGVLALLEAGGIPLSAADRADNDPVVIMGGPCVSNPLPYSRFIDAFWIGEAEGGFFDLMQEAADLKQAGAGRAALLKRIAEEPSVWVPGKAGVIRAIDTGFADRPRPPAVFPVPTMKVVQHHGAVEIMRGCPNGCRFCHAGYWYRPMRQKPADRIQQEVAAYIAQGGYREISLSSLSTGDYAGLDQLVEALNADYAAQHISFQLPSLRVSTFSLPLLEKIAEVRKSGLTFAVETPVDARQRGLNKEVSRDDVAAILKEARKQGWKGAKFYFMVGLPCADQENSREEAEIIDFILDMGRQTGMRFTVNVGTFVPKPHTPYQQARQLPEAEARRRLDAIRSALKPAGHKVSVQDPFVSVLEGLMSRGDERVGALIEQAYRGGCRLDAWTEYLRKDIWRSLLEAEPALVEEVLAGGEAAQNNVGVSQSNVGDAKSNVGVSQKGGEKAQSNEKSSQNGGNSIEKNGNSIEKNGWSQVIQSRVSRAYLEAEVKKSEAGELTAVCSEDCEHYCGVCGEDGRIQKNTSRKLKSLADFAEKPAPKPVGSKGIPESPEKKSIYRVLFTFTKKQSAIFQPHLAVIELLSMAFIRAKTPIVYSEGFNPLPRLEIPAPLRIGIEADAEIACVDTAVPLQGAAFRDALNPYLPEGVRIVAAIAVTIPEGSKKHALSPLLWGFSYKTSGGTNDLVPAKDEKAYILAKTGGAGYGLVRHGVFARNPNDPTLPADYFSIYPDFYASKPKPSAHFPR